MSCIYLVVIIIFVSLSFKIREVNGLDISITIIISKHSDRAIVDLTWEFDPLSTTGICYERWAGVDRPFFKW